MAAGEVATSAETAQAVALVQARYVMARSRPRNVEQTRVALLAECRRVDFAEGAKYLLPFGEGVTGPSIRFAEAAFRCMGNIWSHAMVTFDDAEKRILTVMVTDLESNVTFEDSIIMTKTVERKRLKKGQKELGTRLNSSGQTLYIVEASESEMRAKQGAEVSKAVRTLGLRHLPGDIREAGLREVDATLSKDAKENPEDARRRLVDSFANIGVEPEHLVTFLRHSLQQMTPAEFSKLRGIHAAMKEGQITWNEVVINAGLPDEPSKTSRTAETLRNKRGEQDGKPPAKQPDPPPPPPPAEDYSKVGPPAMGEEPPASDDGDNGAAGF
jgi:hypothetical protein